MRERVQSGIARMGMVCALGLMVCSVMLGQEVGSNAMPGIDFSRYHTYKWVAIEGGTHPNQIADAEIKQAVDAQMQAKGFTKTDSDNANLLVGYQVAVNQQKQWNAYGGGGFRWGGGGMASATSSTIDVGSLVLDMYDPTTKQLVWTGTATKTLDTSGNQQKNQKNLDKSMEKLLKKFPPK